MNMFWIYLCDSSSLIYYSHDTFALELFAGYLYVVLDHSGKVVRQRIDDQKVNTGQAQNLTLTFKNWGAAVTVSYYTY